MGITEDWFSTAQYFDIKNGHHGLEQVAIAIGANYNLTGKGEPERVGTIRVSSNLLPMLGMHAELGRLFVADEDQPGRTPTALLSYGTWTRRYGSDPAILGKTITLNGMPYEVVGVMPRSFSLPREVMPTLDGAEQAEVLLPLAASRQMRPRTATTRTTTSSASCDRVSACVRRRRRWTPSLRDCGRTIPRTIRPTVD